VGRRCARIRAQAAEFHGDFGSAVGIRIAAHHPHRLLFFRINVLENDLPADFDPNDK
jgi:hypothetical protein